MDTIDVKEVKKGLQTDLQVFEVKNYLPTIELPREMHEILPDVPGVFLFIARCKSGKSVLMSNINLSSQWLGGKVPIFEMNYIISPTIEADPSCQGYFNEEYKERFIINTDMHKNESLLHDIVNYQKTFDRNDPDNLPPLTNIIFDDISGHIKRNSFISDLFSRYRHYNLNLMLANQNITGIPTICRAMATAVFLAKCANVKEKQKILDEWGDLYANCLESAWEYCCDTKFYWCYLKLDELIPRMFKVGPDGYEEVDYKSFRSSRPNKMLDNNITEKLNI